MVVRMRVFNGEVPGDVIISRPYVVHAFIVPAVLVALIALLIRSVAGAASGPDWY
jgi:hypothetical protein